MLFYKLYSLFLINFSFFNCEFNIINQLIVYSVNLFPLLFDIFIPNHVGLSHNIGWGDWTIYFWAFEWTLKGFSTFYTDSLFCVTDNFMAYESEIPDWHKFKLYLSPFHHYSTDWPIKYNSLCVRPYVVYSRFVTVVIGQSAVVKLQLFIKLLLILIFMD